MQNDNNLNTLYQIISNMQKLNIPIAVKGGLLLKASLQEHKSDIDRKTTDIDGNWLKQTPDIEEMRKNLEKAVQMSYPDYQVIIKRPYGEKQSAGFHIIKNNITLAHIDIDVNKITPTKLYMINDIKFHGIPMEQVLCDKIAVLSSPQIMRRTKDLLDMYAITQVIPYDKQTVIELLSKRKLGNFSTLYTQKENIEHAYEKLRGVTNKPEFQQVYESVIHYCKDINNSLTSLKIKEQITKSSKEISYANDDDLKLALEEKARQQERAKHKESHTASYKEFCKNVKNAGTKQNPNKDHPNTGLGLGE
ncbi:hypothetical protein C806_01705 [Lachnospiraceae bacterium 3-1]|nr:hypothetical protein C806_01705 [Lachnospiraceae bacterium 3-1]